ncbi:MAG: hypothetical protein JO276_03970 [Sphingomonadaceae bacterium]|nr:hypothetical protein [Sphingomonadaceae bacterium]
MDQLAKLAFLVGVASSLASGAIAQAPPRSSETTGDRARQIATQPARDVGLQRTTIPPVLERIGGNPYSVTDLGTCARLSAAVVELNAVLGPDYDSAAERRPGRTEQAAEAGGRALVDSVIPFRGVVREISGSAAADRRLQAAIEAGYARRGFLRGLHRARGCGTGFDAAP